MKHHPLDSDDLEALATLAAIDAVQPPAEVKARVMQAVRERPQSIHIVREHEGSWREVAPGVRTKKLYGDRARNTVTLLFVMDPGTRFPAHQHRGAEESFVVRGSCRIGPFALAAGDFHRAEAGSEHGTIETSEGCTILLVMDASDYFAA
jgi:anti-sigma factor ChrR (cupin superfamily)